MNINIALNTIIYIMVFLFPGVLFRKFYFQGKHRYQFTSGNLFERFIITIFLSVFCISTYILIFEVLLNKYLKLHIISPIEYCEFIEIFSALSNNRIPSLVDDINKFHDLSFLFILLYCYSIGLGYFFYVFINKTKIDNYFAFLRFTNEVDYLFYSPSKEIKKSKTSKRLSINVDVLTKYKDKEVLFQGDLHQVLYNKDNEFDGISLRNVYRFVELSRQNNQDEIKDIEESIARGEVRYSLYKIYENSVSYKRLINSDIFVINKSEIVNYNIFYVRGAKPTQKIKYFKFVSTVALIVLFVSIIALVIFPFISVSSLFFDTIFKRILFSIYSIWQIILTIGITYNSIKTKSSWRSIKDNFIVILFFGSFYLWFFNVTHWLVAILIAFSFSVFMERPKKKNDENHNIE